MYFSRHIGSETMNLGIVSFLNLLVDKRYERRYASFLNTFGEGRERRRDGEKEGEREVGD